jgi:tellurite resistance protein TerB
LALEWLKEQKDKLQSEVQKFKNKSFAEGVIAGCALVAAADGSIDSSEKQKMIGFIENSDELKAFDTGEIIEIFNKFVSKFEFDQMIGQAEALKAVGKSRENASQARLLVRVCCAIGAADGDFDNDERATVRTICQELGLDPSEFDL